MRRAFLASIIAMFVSANLLFSAVGAAGGPVPFACSGAKADAARKVAKDHTWPLGMDPKACFGEMQLTERAQADCGRGAFTALQSGPAAQRR